MICEIKKLVFIVKAKSYKIKVLNKIMHLPA